MPPTANFETEFNGLRTGEGTPYKTISIAGLDLPPVRDHDLPRALADGDFPGALRLGPRTIEQTIEVKAATAAETKAALAALAGSYHSDNPASDFLYRLPGDGNRRVGSCTARRCNFSVDKRLDFGFVVVTVAVVATSPRIFDVASGLEVVI